MRDEANEKAAYLAVIETEKNKNQRRQHPCGQFVLQGCALLCTWRLSRSDCSRGRGRHRIGGGLFGNYIFFGILVRPNVINELILNGMFRVFSLGMFQEQVAFLRGKFACLSDLIDSRSKFLI